jgi:hypothetical protein
LAQFKAYLRGMGDDQRYYLMAERRERVYQLWSLYLRVLWAVTMGKFHNHTYMEQNNLPELNLAARVYSFAMCAGKYKAHTIAVLTQYQNLMEERQKTSTC